jgi:UPF0755 protein
MKKGAVSLLVLLLIVVTGVFVGYRWWNGSIASVSDNETPIYFVVPKGASAMQIGNKLYNSGLIRSTLAYKVYVQFFGKAKKINAGQFKLDKTMSVLEIIETLQGGPLELWVTIPEGLRKEEMVDIFVESLQMDPAAASGFEAEFLNLTKGKEGYLFPDTYLFPPEVTASMVVGRLESVFNTKVDEFKDGIEESAYSLDQIITMASILERETKTDEERPIVAGILWKRLEADGWLLQADATVQYAIANSKLKTQNSKLKDYWPILTKTDLDIDSPYNSYKYKPLPPTPIANPGLSSIKAAIYPESSDYWFYIHDADGVIHYAETIQQHNENVRKYLRKE